MTGFWRRLRKRKVVQWSLGYAVAALAVLEGVDLLVSHFGWPELVFRWAAVAAATGLLLTVVLAWFHGETGAQRVGLVELSLLGVILLAGAGAAWMVQTPEAPEGGPGDVPPRSVAVLPFVNASGSAENEYFSDGISVEIMNSLAQVPDLFVAARTSSFAFKGLNLPADEIARQLGVSQLLDGTVRRSGDRVRITVQLIDAESGRTLWSAPFDRLVGDVFAVQAEIATKVAQELRLRSALVFDPGDRGTDDAEAFDLYLRGLHAVNTVLDFPAGRDYLERSVARDSTFALAFAALSEAYSQLDEPERAKDAAEAALGLDPDLPQARVALAFTLAFNEWRWAEAEAEFEKALDRNPNFVLALLHQASLLSATGRHDAAIAVIERAQRLDPLSLRVEVTRGIFYLEAGRYSDAVAQFERVEELEPGNQLGRELLARSLHGADRVTEAVAVWESLGDSLKVALASDDRARARSMLEAGATGVITDGVTLAGAWARVGDQDHALDVLDSLYAERYRLLFRVGSEPALDGMRENPRFLNLLRRIGLGP